MTSLICLPFAGAGASFFRAWHARLPQSLRVEPSQLPGREERFAEPPYTSVPRAADEVYARLVLELEDNEQVALFGHSLGAVLAYETALKFVDAQDDRLIAMFVSGSPPPWAGRTERLSDLPDDEFVRQLQSVTGHAPETLSDPEMRRLLLPLLRADVAMHENYRPTTRRRVDIPLTSVRGKDDRLVSREEIEAWSTVTTGPFQTFEVAGGHMYLTEEPDELIKRIAAQVDDRRS